MGEGFYHGSYDISRGFAYSKLRILHGSNYTAYFSDALLMAAWTDGSLNEVAEKPSWWRRDEPGLRLKKSTIELRVTDDGLELVVPDDFALDSSAKTAIEKEFPTFNGVHLTIAQTERDGAWPRGSSWPTHRDRLAAAGWTAVTSPVIPVL